MLFPRCCHGKESTCQPRRYKRRGFDPWVGKIAWRRKWQPTPVFLPGKSHGQRILEGYSPWGCKELGMTQHTHTHFIKLISSVQSLSCVWLCDPTDCSTPGLPIHHQLLELAQTHVHRVDDAIQSFHPLLSPSLPAFNLSQHQGLFQWVSSLHQVARVLEFQLQHQSFQWIFGTDFL